MDPNWCPNSCLLSKGFNFSRHPVRLPLLQANCGVKDPRTTNLNHVVLAGQCWRKGAIWCISGHAFSDGLVFAVTPLDTTKVTFSTDPSARTATVTIGDTRRCFKLTQVTPKHLPRQAYLCKGIEPQVHAPTYRTPLSRDHQSQPSAYRRRPPYRPHRRQCHRQCHQWRHHSFISPAKFVRKSQ